MARLLCLQRSFGVLNSAGSKDSIVRSLRTTCMLIAAILAAVTQLLRSALALVEKSSCKANCLYYRQQTIGDFAFQCGMFIVGIHCATFWIITINTIVLRGGGCRVGILEVGGGDRS